MDRTWKRGALMVAVVAGLGLSGLGLAGCTSLGGKTSKVATTNPCEDLSVAIYFDQESAQVTKEAKSVLREAADMRKGCSIGVVDVLGLADAVGDPRANLKLSEQRAKAVTQALGSLGFGNVNIAAAGETGSVTAGGESRPLRRRADVVFKSGG